MNGFYEYVKMAVQNIRANKGRSFLTMLGIIIGIASVIAIVSIGEGTKNQMNSEISDIGGGQVYIYVSNDAITEQEWITPEDINAVRELESVEGVSVAESYDGETVTGKGNFNLMVTAEGPDPKMVNNADMKYGNYFGEREVEEAKPVRPKHFPNNNELVESFILGRRFYRACWRGYLCDITGIRVYLFGFPSRHDFKARSYSYFKSWAVLWFSWKQRRHTADISNTPGIRPGKVKVYVGVVYRISPRIILFQKFGFIQQHTITPLLCFLCSCSLFRLRLIFGRCFLFRLWFWFWFRFWLRRRSYVRICRRCGRITGVRIR